MPSKRESAPIAIIGMGLRLPGGVSTGEDFWDLLVNGKSGRCKVPSDRYNVDGFRGGTSSQREKVASEYGYFLKDVNLKGFDTSFFQCKEGSVEMLDPQQRLLLEVVWECIESAGQTKLQGTQTGVFVGAFGEDWHNMLHMDKQDHSATDRVIGAGDYAISNRISFEYDFGGPSVTIRTACSASLTGLHFACQALQNGDCPTAIVAGTNIIMDPSMTLDMTQKGVLSPSGSCKTFDAAADGYSRGEAINAILIKPLEDALRDGDPIRAVIRSTALNSCGKTVHISYPNVDAQEELIRKAYRIAGIDDFSQTPFIECHGTGTMTGDPIETTAIGKVFGEHGIYIGSVKPNLGHGEGASGLTGVIKAVLSLEHEIIPPNINYYNPNPKIGFEKYNLKVPVEPTAWPKDRQTRISINSFGIGGSNAHAILESATSFGIPGYRTQQPVEQMPKQSQTASEELVRRDESSRVEGNAVTKYWPRLLPVSASSEWSLQARVDGIQKYVESRPESINNIASTLGLHRIHQSYRTFCMVEDGLNAPLDFNTAQKTLVPSADVPLAVFVFTGQGAQWRGMGESLLQTLPSFRQDIEEMDRTLQGLAEPPSWTIESLLPHPMYEARE